MLSFPDQTFITTKRQGDAVLVLCTEWNQWSTDIIVSDHWIRNTKRKIAILRYAARFRTGSNVTRKFRKKNDVSLHSRRYYISYSGIVSFVRAFYKVPDNSEYTLLIDVCTYQHSTVLAMTRTTKGRVPSYSFHAFDPNYTCNSHNFVEVAQGISRSVKTINVWYSRSVNGDGLCFALSWRFIHAVMFEGYDAYRYEKVACVYNVLGRKPVRAKPKKGAARNQLIGYYATRQFNRKVFKLKLNNK